MADEWDLLDLAIDTANRIRDWARWTIIHKIAPSQLAAQSVNAPGWFTHTYKAWVWKDNLDSHNRPTSTWLKYYIRATWNYLLHKLRGEWEDAIGYTQTIFRNLVGALRYGYTSVSDWLTTVYERAGAALEIWTDNLSLAVNTLYYWLPKGIRLGVNEWRDFFVYWYEKSQEWVSEQFGDALAGATDAWDWVVNYGQRIKAWYNTVSAWALDWAQNAEARVKGLLGASWRWLQALVADPYGVISIILGSRWASLVSWAQGPLDYYYNLWGSYATTLSDFLADPLGWLYDRAEEELVRRW